MNCVICNKEISKSMFSNKNLCSSECFQFNFWDENIKIKDELHIARIKGEQYYIGNEARSNPFRGFGGRRFIVRFLDGREVISTNLWYNGKIPESHIELLPDNAEFVEGGINLNEKS